MKDKVFGEPNSKSQITRTKGSPKIRKSEIRKEALVLKSMFKVKRLKSEKDMNDKRPLHRFQVSGCRIQVSEYWLSVI